MNVSDFLTPGYEWFLSFFKSLIMYQNIIPIALYLSLEATKTVQSVLIHMDIDMWDEESKQAAQPKAWNLCDDLGQIEYIFSDKTGTLTSNTMELKKVSINGVQYGKWITATVEGGKSPEMVDAVEKEKKLMIKRFDNMFNCKYMDPNPGFVDADIPFHILEKGEQGKKIREFFSLLAICHTVLVEKPDANNPDQLFYRAQSPDEAALVGAAKNMGFVCLHRSENKIEIDLMGESRIYTVLNIMEFNSDRKRMSVIIQRPEGDIVLLCKGADSVIYERLDVTSSEPIMEATSSHLQTFANDGRFIEFIFNVRIENSMSCIQTIR